MKRHICIITPTYISMNPRVVKEADALYDAGFRVRVVFSEGNYGTARQFDKDILMHKKWKRDAVRWSPHKKDERLLYYKSKIRHHVTRSLPSIFLGIGRLVEHGEGRVYSELCTVASSEKADLYIGHYPIGLAAAAFSATRWNARFGFDSEDLHTEEMYVKREGRKQKRRIGTIERRYLRKASYVTAVSEPVADKLMARYHIERPFVIHNVFSLKERNGLDGKIIDRRGPALSLYWYSQIIGKDRGITDAIKATGALKGKAQLHLRGYLSEETKNEFLALARQYGSDHNIYFHPQVPPRELLSRAAEHDVGLALERRIPASRELTVTNKFFFYMMSGLAIAATDTIGQKHILSSCPESGFIYPAGDYRTLADRLYEYIVYPDKLQLHKQISLKAAYEKWNWETESKKFITVISRALS